MLLDMALYWLVGMPVVAAAISSACQEIRMSKNDTRQFWLEGVGCHEPGSNDKYLGKIDLGQCIGVNPDTSKLEWKRLCGTVPTRDTYGKLTNIISTVARLETIASAASPKRPTTTIAR